MYVVDKAKNWSFISLVTGVLAMFLWIIPALGYAVGIAALFLGVFSMEADERDGAVAGIVLGLIAVVFSFARAFLVYFYG